MPLDPEAKAFVDGFSALPPWHTQTPQEARDSFAGLIAAMPKADIMATEDHTIPGPAGPIPVRLYRPCAGTLPVVMYFHGGGWVIGDLESHDAPLRDLANVSGCLVVAVDYRLAPEHPFPAAVDDCYAALLYVAQHAASFGGDSSRLAVAGDSAGGNLAAVTALLARDRQGPALRHQLLIYPVTDYNLNSPSMLECADGYFLTRELMQWFWTHYLGSWDTLDDPRLVPLRAEQLAGLPPATVYTAQYDPLRDEGEAYAARLGAAGVPTTTVRYNGMVHGFFMPLFTAGRFAINAAGATLKAALAD